MTPNFTPWLDQIHDSHILNHKPNRCWFAQVIEMLIEFGFELQSDEVAIIDGRDLEWKCRHARVMTKLFIDFPVTTEWPGIELSDEMESWEAVLQVRTPLNVVRLAIEELNPPPVVEPSLP